MPLPMPSDLVLSVMRRSVRRYSAERLELALKSPGPPAHVIVDGAMFMLMMAHVDVPQSIRDSRKDGLKVCSVMIVQKVLMGVTVCPNRGETRQVWKALKLRRPKSQLVSNQAYRAVLMWEGKI